MLTSFLSQQWFIRNVWAQSSEMWHPFRLCLRWPISWQLEKQPNVLGCFFGRCLQKTLLHSNMSLMSLHSLLTYQSSGRLSEWAGGSYLLPGTYQSSVISSPSYTFSKVEKGQTKEEQVAEKQGPDWEQGWEQGRKGKRWWGPGSSQGT